MRQKGTCSEKWMACYSIWGSHHHSWMKPAVDSVSGQMDPSTCEWIHIGPKCCRLACFSGRKSLRNVLRKLGEENFAGRIARAIVTARDPPDFPHGELAGNRTQAVPRQKPKKRHPATKTFQAIRIFLNDELGQLASALEASLNLLAPAVGFVLSVFTRSKTGREAFHAGCFQRTRSIPGTPRYSRGNAAAAEAHW